MKLDLSFGVDDSPEEPPPVDYEKLNRLIGVLQKKETPTTPAQFLIAMSYDEMTELADFLEDNALPSEEVIKRLQTRLETKITLAEKHL